MTKILPTFTGTWNEVSEPKLRKMSYGDGYEQVAPDGINHQLRKWKVSYSQQRGDMVKPIYDFLRDTGGVDAFLCRPPGEVAMVLVRLDGGVSRDFTHQNAVVDLSFSLREVVL